MREYEQSIRGFRIVGDPPKPDKKFNVDYMHHAHGEEALHSALWKASQSTGANCLNREEEFSGEDLPSDREAQLLCASCPVLDLCRAYAEVAHPAWGVFGGRVYGRNLQKAMED